MEYSEEETRRVLGILRGLGITTREQLHAFLDARVTFKQATAVKGVGEKRAPILQWLRGLSAGDWVAFVGPLEDKDTYLPADSEGNEQDDDVILAPPNEEHHQDIAPYEEPGIEPLIVRGKNEPDIF